MAPAVIILSGAGDFHRPTSYMRFLRFARFRAFRAFLSQTPCNCMAPKKVRR